MATPPSEGREIRCTVEGSTPNSAAFFRTPAVSGSESFTDALFDLEGYRGAAEPFDLSARPRQPCADSFTNHGPLELAKHAHHLEHGLTGGGAGIETLLMQEQVDPE